MAQPLLFYLLSAALVICAILVVSVRNVFHAGLFLIGTFLGVSGIYLVLNNYFLAAVQALVYSGAIAVLILFGIMLTQRTHGEDEPRHTMFRLATFLLCCGLLTVLGLAYWALPWGGFAPEPELLRKMGEALMGTYFLPFEIISVLLLAALIGALVLAKETEESP